MFEGNLYTVESVQHNNEQSIYRIELNANHIIFAAHFAGNPLLPGACIVQIAKELISKTADKELYIEKIPNLKFINTITPEVDKILWVHIVAAPFEQCHSFSYKIEIRDGTKIFSKFNLKLTAKDL
jgi:3-hydroxyacyl-[acyl-carrier-protein] dehydratase